LPNGQAKKIDGRGVLGVESRASHGVKSLLSLQMKNVTIKKANQQVTLSGRIKRMDGSCAGIEFF